MKPNIPNQKSKYLEHGERLDSYTGMIRQVYDTYNFEASKLALMVDYDGSKPFSFDDFPQTKYLIDKLRTNFSGDIQNVIVNGIKSEWSESNKVQDQLVRKVCSAYGIDVNHDDFPKKFARYFSNNGEALKSFIERKKGGLNLSQRVWNLSSDYKSGLEAALSVGIDKGTSAKQLSKKISQYLHDFEGLRSDYTERFGKANNILDCEYRAARLARTEINMSYRSAEQERWRKLDFVVGYEIKRSGRPFPCSVCEGLTGKYPKTFKFTGWHPSCRCYSIAILKAQDEFFDDSTTSKNEVKEVPQNFKDWILQNNSRIEEAKQRGTLPYFLKDNDKLIPNNKLNPVSNIVQPKYKSIDDLLEHWDYERFEARGSLAEDGVTVQGYVGELQGFNELPSVVSEADYAKIENDDNYIKMYRGFRRNADENVHNFLYGKLYEGEGAYGNGSYFSVNKNVSLSSYVENRNEKHLISAAFDKNKVKIADFDELKETFYRQREENGMSTLWTKIKQSGISKDPLACDILESKLRVYEEFGAWCTAQGYDIIYIKSEEFYVMLNRTSLVVKKM